MGEHFYIRTDMNPAIATGHVMRCLSIADALREKGAEVSFISADKQAVSLTSSRGYECIVLESDWNNKEGELDILLELIRKKDIQRLLVDSYQVTELYLKQLSQATRVYYLDDLNAFPYPVYAVINYEHFATEDYYPVRHPDTQYYLGCSYAPLREMFRDCGKKKIGNEVNRILLMCGGSDGAGILDDILSVMPPYRYASIDVLCGRLNLAVESLKEKYAEMEEIHIHSYVENVREYYEKADVAISAGGSTLYELCAVGVPTITFSIADDQLENVKSFALDGLMEYAGDIRKGQVPEQVLEYLQLYEDRNERVVRSTRTQRLVDGRGSLRLADILLGD